MKICGCDSKASLQEPCRIVKPEDKSLFTDDYWLRLADQLESERFVLNLWILLSYCDGMRRNPPLLPNIFL